MQIERVVRLSFKEDKVSDFVAIFNESKNKILAFEGCLDLRLMRDLTNPGIYYTMSKWVSPAALENYRQSILFRETWKRTRELFSAPASAYSLVAASDDNDKL